MKIIAYIPYKIYLCNNGYTVYFTDATRYPSPIAYPSAAWYPSSVAHPSTTYYLHWQPTVGCTFRLTDVSPCTERY